jgi:predicted metal-dependent peptidase
MTEDLNKKIQRVRIQIILNYPWFASAILHTTTKIQPLKGAYAMVTQTGEITYDTDTVIELSEHELIFITLHEIMHLLLLHFLRRDNREAKRWNIACDIAVDNWLQDMGVKTMPAEQTSWFRSNGFRFNDLNAEKIYEKIPDQEVEKFPRFDIHDESPPQNMCSVDSNQEEGWKEILRGTLELYKTFTRGLLPGTMVEAIHDVLYPRLPWRSVLTNFIQQKRKSGLSWVPPNRRLLQYGIYLPGYYEEVLKAVVAIDTSGSIDDRTLHVFCGALQEIIEGVKSEITLIQCDAEIQEIHENITIEEISKINIKGRGGTDFRPVFKWIIDSNEQYDCLIYLTDGNGSFPSVEDVTIPTLWVLTQDCDIPKGIGDKIVMDIKE